MVEVEYFIELTSILPELKHKVSEDQIKQLRKVYGDDFSVSDALEIKKIEAVTNHDVKAVEYFVKKHFDALGLQDQKEFIHFALTSQVLTTITTASKTFLSFSGCSHPTD
jgi:adenylosuccinate lyase